MIQFSIVIPLYNKQQTILRALDSIESQIYKNFEVIIVNDGSNDNSQVLVHNWINFLNETSGKKYNLINQLNSGASDARNNGVKKAQYDYIAFLDADDYWEKSHLTNLSLLIDEFSDRVDIFSNYCIQLQNGYFIYPKLANYKKYFGIVDYFKVSLISNGFINSSSVCVKKNAIVDCPFPMKMKNFEDTITWARISNNKGFAFSSTPTVVYVLENIEASVHIKFKNYLMYEKLLLKLDHNQFSVRVYFLKFLILHILFARLNMSFKEYLIQLISIFCKSFTISTCLIIGVFVPKFILKYARNIRKKNDAD